MKIVLEMVSCFMMWLMRCFLPSMFGYKSLFHCSGASFAFLFGILHHHKACRFHGFGLGQIFCGVAEADEFPIGV